MTPLWTKAFLYLMQNEGKTLVNDPSDSGGTTKFGLSKWSYPNVDIASLTEDEAKAIYYRDFWIPSKAEQFVGEKLAIKHFDTGVNIGLGTAAKILQDAVNFFEPPESEIVVDGNIGVNTLQRVNQFIKARDNNESLFIAAYISHLALRYEQIIDKSSKNAKFARAWIARAFRLPVIT